MSQTLLTRPTPTKPHPVRLGGGGPVALSRFVAITGVLVIIGLMPWLSGQSAEYTVLRARYADREATPEALASVRAELGLDQGPWVLLAQWVMDLLRGDLGDSWITGDPVGPGTIQALGVSLTLMLCSLVVTGVTALILIIRPMRSGLRFRPTRGSGVVAVALAALPSFLLAAILLVVVAVWLGWLPPYGWAGLRYAILPSLALGIPAGAYQGRLLADAVTGAWSESWVRTWALGGATNLQLSLGVLRRSVAVLITQVALIVIGLIGGAVAVEQIFAIPGLGRALLGAAAAQDVAAAQAGMVLLLALAVIMGGLASLARRALVGPALKTGSIPVPRPLAVTNRSATVVSIAAVGALLVMVTLGLLRDPYAVVYGRLSPPSWALPLGADAAGRDMLARVGHGAMTTLGTALVVTLVTLVLGVLIGLLGKWAVGFIEVANALPSIIVGLIVAAVLGPSLGGAALAVALTAWAPLAAHTHDLITEVKARPYIQLQPLWGVGPARQLFMGVLPEVVPTITRHAMLRLPGRVLELAPLSFLGLGPKPPSPDWGLLLAEGIDYVERAPWAVLAPTTALVLAAVAAVAGSARYGRR